MEEPMTPGDEAPEGAPSTGQDTCPVCHGSGKADGDTCEHCGGDGTVTEAVGGG